MIKTLLRQASRFALQTALCVVCWVPTSAQAAGASVSPNLISGDMVRMRGQWMTKSQSAEIGLPGGGRISVHEDSQASILTDPQSLALLPGMKLPTYSVIVRRGLVDIELPNEDRARVAVVVGTPTDIRLVILSGHTAVKVDGRKITAVNHKGVASVAHGAKLLRLPPALKRTYQSTGSFADAPMIDAAQWVGGRRVWIAAPGKSVTIAGFVWAPVPGAATYVASLRELNSLRVADQIQVSEPVVHSFRKPITPGKYELDIVAVDGDGFMSSNHVKFPIAVLGLELPGGAVALAKDTVVIAAEQRIRLTHADGVTLTTADHRTGVQGSTSFGLEGLERATVLIHPPNGGDGATLTLVRRAPLVSAWVGPKLATWPDDPVRLQVSFVDEQGAPIPSSVEPTVRVLVGVDPVNVEWEKQDSLWQAKLPPLEGSGPWVVRLEVVDQHGAIIGRDFAEITKTHKSPKFPQLDPRSAVASRP